MSGDLRAILFVAAMLVHLGSARAMSADTFISRDGEWRFQVSLDQKPIGYHLFQLTSQDGSLQLRSEARFNVKFLFLNAYRYVHDDSEIWSEGCLKGIDSRTDDNGKQYRVNGAQETERFQLSVNGKTSALDRCVLTFAYWNPEILKASRLLNSQTGEYMPVTIRRVALESVAARNASVAAQRYRIEGMSADGSSLKIDLWYSADMHWLALESITDDGRRLRYQLQ